MFFLSSYVIIVLSVFWGSLSCWKRLWPVRCCPHSIGIWIIIWNYFSAFIIPLMLIKSPTLLDEMLSPLMTKPSPCFKDDCRHSLLCLCPNCCLYILSMIWANNFTFGLITILFESLENYCFWLKIQQKKPGSLEAKCQEMKTFAHLCISSFLINPWKDDLFELYLNKFLISDVSSSCTFSEY